MSRSVKTKRYIGIDLGTTFSAMAYLDSHGSPVTIPNAEGTLTTPSVVYFEPSGEVVVGAAARLAAVEHPDLVVQCVKREMGERFYPRTILGRKIPPPAISALILKKLKQDAEAKIGPIDGAVITVPAYFDEGRRQATIAGGQIAGLEVLDILNEPTAASLAFAYRNIKRKSDGVDDVLQLVDDSRLHRIAVVYDLGGGTFDVTVLKIQGNNLTVLATDGDVRLGGKDWDDKLLQAAANAFKTKYKTDPREDEHSYEALLGASEECKCVLSTRDRARLSVTHLGKHATLEVTRAQFEEMTASLLYRTESRLNRVIDAARLPWDQVDEVLTVGGSTRMPQVLAMLQRVTGQKPNTSLSPDEVVAHGAAIHAAITQLKNYQAATKTVSTQSTPTLLLDDEAALPMLEAELPPVAPTLEISPEFPPVIPPVDSPVDPAAQTIAENTGLAPESTPAPLAEVLANPSEQYDDNEATDVLRAITTSNVNAHSLGVVMTNPDKTRANSTVIPKNTNLPTSVTRRYGTVIPNQTSVSVIIVEGDAPDPDQCIPIGKCTIEKLPWGLRKGSTIYVTLSYDNSGRLDVKATEATSGSSAQTTIDRANAMNESEIDQAQQAVEKMAVR